MNVEVFISNRCIISLVVREDEANDVAAHMYREYKIGLLQLLGIPASVVISGVRSKMNGPEITEFLTN